MRLTSLCPELPGCSLEFLSVVLEELLVKLLFPYWPAESQSLTSQEWQRCRVRVQSEQTESCRPDRWPQPRQPDEKSWKTNKKTPLVVGRHFSKKAPIITTPQLVVYLPVVVSALPSGAPGVAGPCASAVGTVEVVSALAMVTSLALLASSPQWGQKL